MDKTDNCNVTTVHMTIAVTVLNRFRDKSMRKRVVKKSAIQFHVRVPISLMKEGDIWVAACPPLDVVSQGETEEEATKNLGEAVSLFVETAYNMGTLDQVLSDCGYVPVDGGEAPENDTIDVPLPLLVAQEHAQANTG